MEKFFSDMSVPLVIWQLLILVLLGAAVFYGIKLYKKVMACLDKNTGK